MSAKKLRFRDLGVGDIFYMQSTMLLSRPFSDGPWVKTGKRTYKPLDNLRGVGEVRVGTINVEVRREPEYRGLNVQENPAGQNWYPSLIAIGRDDRSYMAITVDRAGGTYGYDFPTLRQSFPVDFDPRRIGLFDGRAGYDLYSDRTRYRLFKVRSGGKWTKPLPLDTRITFDEFERVTGLRRDTSATLKQSS